MLQHVLSVSVLSSLSLQAPNLVIHQPEERLSAMDEWCTTHHTNSGLVDAVRASKVCSTVGFSELIHRSIQAVLYRRP